MTDTPADTAARFARDIEELCAVHGVGVIDAVTTWCERNGVEVESVVSLVKKDPALRARLQVEAEALHMVKPTGRRLAV